MKITRILAATIFALFFLNLSAWAVLDGGVCTTADKGGVSSTSCSPSVLVNGINEEHAYALKIGVQTLTNVIGSSSITASLPIPLTAYVDQSFNIKFPSNNAGALTLSIAGLPAKPITSNAGLPLSTNEIKASNLYVIRYFSANDQFRIMGSSSSSSGSPSTITEQNITIVAGVASWDMASTTDASITLTTNTTLQNPINQAVGSRGVLRIIQDATGGRLIALGTYYKFFGSGSTQPVQTASYQTEWDYHVVASSGVGSIELSLKTSNEAGFPRVILEHQAPSNTNFINNAGLNFRYIGTVVRNVGNLTTLNSSQFTLPAGTYRVHWEAMAANVGAHRSYLFNVTDSVKTVLGTSNYNGPSFGDGVFTITATKTFDMRHFAQSANYFGLGSAEGSPEVFLRIMIW
jgi:hypothetical protein